MTASTVGYSVGALNIPGHELPWEETLSGCGLLTLEIDASNIERREYLKPMLFSGGVGQLDERHLHKGKPERDMLVVKVGGPAYHIGLGGRAWTACCVCCRWAASAS